MRLPIPLRANYVEEGDLSTSAGVTAGIDLMLAMITRDVGHRLIEFLEALIKDADRRIFLILDNLRAHHSKLVKAWLETRKDQIEIFYLPSYSPELNPD